MSDSWIDLEYLPQCQDCIYYDNYSCYRGNFFKLFFLGLARVMPSDRCEHFLRAADFVGRSKLSRQR